MIKSNELTGSPPSPSLSSPIALRQSINICMFESTNKTQNPNINTKKVKGISC